MSEEEKGKIQGLPRTLSETLDALEKDRDYLTRGGVFPEELLQHWIKKKRKESEEIERISHPAEYTRYYDL